MGLLNQSKEFLALLRNTEIDSTPLPRAKYQEQIDHQVLLVTDAPLLMLHPNTEIKVYHLVQENPKTVRHPHQKCWVLKDHLTRLLNLNIMSSLSKLRKKKGPHPVVLNQVEQLCPRECLPPVHVHSRPFIHLEARSIDHPVLLLHQSLRRNQKDLSHQGCLHNLSLQIKANMVLQLHGLLQLIVQNVLMIDLRILMMQNLKGIFLRLRNMLQEIKLSYLKFFLNYPLNIKIWVWCRRILLTIRRKRKLKNQRLLVVLKRTQMLSQLKRRRRKRNTRSTKNIRNTKNTSIRRKRRRRRRVLQKVPLKILMNWKRSYEKRLSDPCQKFRSQLQLVPHKCKKKYLTSLKGLF